MDNKTLLQIEELLVQFEKYTPELKMGLMDGDYYVCLTHNEFTVCKHGVNLADTTEAALSEYRTTVLNEHKQWRNQ